MNSARRDRELDGIRLLAFLLVFCNHLGLTQTLPFTVGLSNKGWIGVDLFFALSAYLLFEMLERSRHRHEVVPLGEYVMRRATRIYPLMIGYSLAMLLIFNRADPLAWASLASQALALNNLVTLFRLPLTIPYTAHLWSLSYELQVYLAVPVLFLLLHRTSPRRYLLILALVAVYAALARATLFALGAQHPIVYFLPLARPESYLIGIVVWTLRPTWAWIFSACAAIAGLVALFLLPNPWTDPVSNIIFYPLLAITMGATIDAVRRGALLRRTFSFGPIAFLGKRGYGLYVYHVLMLNLTKYLARITNTDTSTLPDWLLFTAVALGLTFAAAALSFPLEVAVQRRLRNTFQQDRLRQLP
jgi:peptidoglycan/LPS O-acetylase OafA/YrhL